MINKMEAKVKQKRQRRTRLPHEKKIYKALIDADMTVNDIANNYGVTAQTVIGHILRGNEEYVYSAIRAKGQLLRKGA